MVTLTMDGREEVGDEVLVEAPILTHFMNLLPLGVVSASISSPDHQTAM